jgi:D-hydroxyproline dehydrogenase subunit alpha
VLTVAEQAPLANVARFAASLWRRPRTLAQAIGLRSAFATTRFRTGTWVAGARGDSTVKEVTLTDGRSTRTLACDVLCAAFGLVPNTELARLLACDVVGGAVRTDDAQMTTIADVYCCGEPTGIGGVDLALVEGEIAGFGAAGVVPSEHLAARRAVHRREAASLERAFALRPELLALADAETIVCRCEDVRWGAIDRRWSARQAKLYTRLGMGACQGRVCGAALECLLGWPADSVRVPAQPARSRTLIGVSLANHQPNEQGAS